MTDLLNTIAEPIMTGYGIQPVDRGFGTAPGFVDHMRGLEAVPLDKDGRPTMATCDSCHEWKPVSYWYGTIDQVPLCRTCQREELT
jgi:hypothetical protein